MRSNVFSNPIEFNYDTDFPEPGLSQALLATRPLIEEHKTRLAASSQAVANLYEVTIVREILHHFRVAEGDVSDRMEAMGMRLQYENIEKDVGPLLDDIPLREPGDESPFVFSW